DMPLHYRTVTGSGGGCAVLGGGGPRLYGLLHFATTRGGRGRPSPWRHYSMPQPGDIVVERLTGNRAIVIRVVSPEEMICRFRDGRFEERFTVELERA